MTNIRKQKSQKGGSSIISKSDAERTVKLEKERIDRESEHVATLEQILETLTIISKQLSELTEFLRNTR